MMRSKRLILVVGLGAVLLGGTARALDDPHGATGAISCEQCHIAHNTLGEVLIDATDGLVATLCLSCHTPGGWVGMSKVLSAAEIAVPGSQGTSHAWGVPALSPALGAEAPQSAILLDHLAGDGTITCATCHDPHSNSIPPFLRLDNSTNALCLDCHRQRNTASVRTYTGNDLSHPVGQALAVGAGYHNPPLDVDGNPQPSDGNLTNDLVLVGGAVQCTTCHGVHKTDSDSGTVDGF